MNLETRSSRVLLREPTAKDGAEFVSLIRANRTFLRPWVYPPDDLKSYKSYIERISAYKDVALLLCHRSHGSIMGVISLSAIIRGAFQSAHLGCYIGAWYSGNGYMTEGVELLLDHAFRKMKLHRVEANVQPENERSILLVSRLGFRKEGFSLRYLKIGGRWRDHERWAICREEWIGRTIRRRRSGKIKPTT